MVLKGSLLLVSSIFPSHICHLGSHPRASHGAPKLPICSPVCSLVLLAGPLVIVLHPEDSALGMSTPAFDPQSRKYNLKEDNSDHLTSESGMGRLSSLLPVDMLMRLQHHLLSLMHL